MASERAEFPQIVPGAHVRHHRALGAFLLASALAHAAVIIGLPDFMPQFGPPGPSVLEVTILAPQPVPARAPQTVQAQPDPAPPERTRPEQPGAGPQPKVAAARPDKEPKAKEGRAEPEKKIIPDTAKSDSVPAPGTASPAPDAEVVGSFSVGSSRGIAPLATVPDAAAEAAAQQVTPPSFDAAYLSNPAPQYPPAARRAGQQGTVTLRVMVKRDGLPTRVEIEKSSGSRLLDTAAQDAVWSWRFVPARHGTDPIESWVLVPVVFRLEGSP
jgi:protein TonB